MPSFWILFIILLFLMFVSYLLIDRFLMKKASIEKRNRLINIILIIGIILLMVIFLVSMPVVSFFQTFLDSLNSICVLALATTGIVLIFKTSITTNFAQGMIGTFGAFTGAILMTGALSEKLSAIQLSFAGLVGGAIISFILGLLIDVLIIRQAKNVTAIGKQMITMGLVLVFSGSMPLIFGVLPLEIPRFSYDIISFNLFNLNLTIPEHYLYTIVITVVVLVILFAALRLTKWGLGVRATASNEVVAKMMGVNTKFITAASWAIAGGLGGLAAVLLAPFSQVTVALMIPTQVNGFLASILGGFQTFGGPIIGAIMIPLMSAFFANFNSLWQNVIVYCIILLLVLIKPLGLFGKKIAKKV